MVNTIYCVDVKLIAFSVPFILTENCARVYTFSLSPGTLSRDALFVLELTEPNQLILGYPTCLLRFQAEYIKCTFPFQKS